MSLFLLVLAGLLGGFAAGLLGIGGGIIYILILPFALRAAGVPEEELVQYVIANSLFGTFAASFAAMFTMWKTEKLYLKDTLWVAFTSVVVSLLSLKFIVNTPFYSVQVFNLIVVFLLLLILISTLLAAHKEPAYNENGKRRVPLLSFSGFIGGLVASLSGLGGGAVIVPVLNSALRMDIRRAKSISLGVIVVSAFSMTLYNAFEQPQHEYGLYSTGYLVWPVAGLMSLGVLFGSPLGVRVSRKLPSYAISYAFSCFLIFVMGFKLWTLWQYYH